MQINNNESLYIDSSYTYRKIVFTLKHSSLTSTTCTLYTRVRSTLVLSLDIYMHIQSFTHVSFRRWPWYSCERQLHAYILLYCLFYALLQTLDVRNAITFDIVLSLLIQTFTSLYFSLSFFSLASFQLIHIKIMCTDELNNVCANCTCVVNRLAECS